MTGGQFIGLSVKVQWMDLDSHSLQEYNESILRWVWILLDATRGSWWKARMALSSSKSLVVVRLVVG